MRSALIAVLLLVGCAAPPPDYITKSGMAVYDPNSKSNADEVQAWLDIISEHVPIDTNRVRSLDDVLNGSVLTLDPNEEPSACTASHAVGCSSGEDRSITVGWLECPDLFSTPATLAHEIGHLLGYHHDEFGRGGPWFKNDTTTEVSFLIWKEVCQ